jgi:hypothetical protein
MGRVSGKGVERGLHFLASPIPRLAHPYPIIFRILVIQHRKQGVMITERPEKLLLTHTQWSLRKT